MVAEIWKPIPSWPGYLASSKGRIMRAVPKGVFKNPRFLTGSRMSSGYFYLQSTDQGAVKQAPVHCLVCEAFHGPCPVDGWECRHLDGSRDNNVPDNLAWGSPRDNAADRKAHGRDRVGIQHHNAKANETAVRLMFEMRAAGASGLDISRKTGINRNTINKIIARTAWAHVAIPDDLIAKAHAVNARRAPASERRAKRRPAGVPLLGGVA